MKRQSFVRKLLLPLGVDKKSLFICIVRGLYRGSFGVLFSYFLKIIIDALTVGQKDQFLQGIIAMALLFVFSGPLGHVFRFHKRKLLTNMQRFLYEKYLQKFINADNTLIEKIGTGRANSVIQKGVDSWALLLRDMPMEGLAIVVGSIGSILLIIKQFGRVGAVIMVVVLLLSSVIAATGNTHISSERKKRRDLYIETDRNIVRYIMSKFEVLQNNKIHRELQKLTGLKVSIIKARYAESIAMIGIIDMHRIVVDSARIIGGVLIGFEVLHSRLTIGDFVLFWTLMKVLADNIEKANLYITDAFQQYINIEKLWNQFDEIPPIKGLNEGEDVVISKGVLFCNAISFGYAENETIFRDFSCLFEGGKKTALVGMSGSGKSTLVKILSGYILPIEGTVQVDGQKLDDIALMSYYKHIGYLTQEPNVFDGTIRENMLYGLSKEALEQDVAVINDKLDTALRMAKCDFVYEFTDGLDTEIGEKGIRLSGGQRQRLAIAKIFLKDPKIIILDEPTSALDSFSEEAITEAMHNLFEGRTVIIIAHRLQTVKAADEILVLDKQPGEGAQVIERGTHEELVKQGGYYARMLEVQTGF